ncbi:MAG TPA: ABC transporter permease [Blastocatellia bacterium]|nr:ABC transporter permease [Blastocatellia bacterium]
MKAASFPVTAYRILLLAYPSEFRSLYGEEMTRTFGELYREEKRQSGLLGIIRLWSEAVFDCAVTAPGEHMEIFFQDIRYAFRVMRNAPGFAIVAIVALALGIGATSAIFSVASALLLRPLPYLSPDRLVWVSGNNLPGGIKDEAASGPDYLDWANQTRTLEEMACFNRWQPTLNNQGEPERIPGGNVTVNFFNVLRANALVGRTFLPQDDTENNRIVILSHGLWQRRFGGDQSVVGKTITLNNAPYLVVGVMRPDFVYPSQSASEIWTPLATGFLAKQPRRADGLGVIGRLKEGATLTQAHAELNTIAEALEKQYPATNTGWRINLVSLQEKAVGRIRPAILTLLGAVAFLLLIACANVSNLLLVRATSRQREIAIRTALGGTRRRLVQQLLTESVILGLAGGLLGLLLAYVGVKGLIAISPANIPRVQEIGIDRIVLGFTLTVSVVTGILFGLVPALQASSPNLTETLKEGGRGSSQGGRSGYIRAALTVAEVSLALVLLTGAGLMIKSFVQLQNVNPGFNTDKVLTASLSLPRAKYADDNQLTSFYQQFVERIKPLPGIQSVSLTSDVPLYDSGDYLYFVVDGRPPLPPDVNQDAEYNVVDPDFFHTMSIPLLKGRVFTERDTIQTTPTAVISDLMARKYWSNEDPVGQKISFGGKQFYEIIGVVGNTRDESLDTPPYAQVYVSYLQSPQRSLSLVVRSTADPVLLVPAIRGILSSLDKDQPLFNIKTMDQILVSSIAQQRLNMLLLSIFAGVALVLAGVGIYGVMSYSVKQRTHEIGVRMALGARIQTVLKLVVGQGMKLAGLGILIGLLVAFGLTRLMAGLLYGVSASDPTTFLVIPVVLAVVALLACFIPARRAGKIDPITALRCE